MTSFTEQAEEHDSRMMQLWSRRYTVLYLILAALSGFTVADLYLPPKKFTTTITHVNQHEERRWRQRGKVVSPTSSAYWSVVYLENGSNFQAQLTSASTQVGDTLDVEVTALRGEVLSYHSRSSEYSSWTELMDRHDEDNLFPVLVCLASLLTLLPVRSLQYRWLMHGALLLLGFSWLITMIGKGGLRLFD